MSNEEKAFISIKDAVRETGISEFSLRRMIANHEIAYLTSGKKYLLNRVRLLEYLEALSMSNAGR